MARINQNQISQAYELGKAVHQGLKTKSQAISDLTRIDAMNRASADYYISAVTCMLGGFLYRKTIKQAATEFFLSKIKSEFGEEISRRAALKVLDHVAYYAQLPRGGPLNEIKSLARVYAHAPPHTTLAALAAEDDRLLADSLADNREDRLSRLKKATGTAQTRDVLVKVFIRNPDVRAEALHAANGICSACGNPAPFCRDNGTLYLEVHHRIPLADGGDDTVANAIALCPNCHREAHFGADKSKFRAISP
jgi:5-methylcytosine-specific restriction enzyme A